MNRLNWFRVNKDMSIKFKSNNPTNIGIVLARTKRNQIQLTASNTKYKSPLLTTHKNKQNPMTANLSIQNN